MWPLIWPQAQERKREGERTEGMRSSFSWIILSFHSKFVLAGSGSDPGVTGETVGVVSKYLESASESGGASEEAVSAGVDGAAWVSARGDGKVSVSEGDGETCGEGEPTAGGGAAD